MSPVASDSGLRPLSRGGAAPILGARLDGADRDEGERREVRAAAPRRARARPATIREADAMTLAAVASDERPDFSRRLVDGDDREPALDRVAASLRADRLSHRRAASRRRRDPDRPAGPGGGLGR